MLELLHTAHRDMEKMKLRTRTTCYWRNISMNIDHFVTVCLACKQYKVSKPKEPMVIHEEPNLPFQQVTVDVVQYERKYLIRIG